MCTFDTA
jgi:hypothetical protein